jgi:hypothetical protein
MVVDMSHSRRDAPPGFVKTKLGVLWSKVNQIRCLGNDAGTKNTAEAVFFVS